MEKDYTASNIRALRQNWGMTQEQLGAAIGCEKNTISMYENGSRNVDSEKRKRFADYFGISVADLTSIDYSTEKPINIDETAFNKYIYKILPVTSSNDKFSLTIELMPTGASIPRLFKSVNNASPIFAL